MVRMYGSQSMIGLLKRVLVRSPIEANQYAEGWRKWGYLRKPDTELAREEHANFVEILKGEGVGVNFVEDTHRERFDAIFTSDPAMVTDRGAVILQMGKELRKGEEEALREKIEEMNIPLLGRVGGAATLEGGDILWLDQKTVIIGRSYRSNSLGFEQLKSILDNFVSNIWQLDLPHWHGPGECLHLLSLISLIDTDLALVYPELAPIALIETLKIRGVQIIEVPRAEFESQGCNALTLEPRKCLTVAGNANIQKSLEKEGVEVIEFEGNEICLNRTGGPTCLVCPILREY